MIITTTHQIDGQIMNNTDQIEYKEHGVIISLIKKNYPKPRHYFIPYQQVKNILLEETKHEHR